MQPRNTISFSLRKIVRENEPRTLRSWLATLPPCVCRVFEQRSTRPTNVRANQRTAREKMVYNLARTTSIAFTVVETFDAVPGHVYGHAQ